MQRSSVKVFLISLCGMLILSFSVLGINYMRKQQLFESLYQKSFCPKPFTVIEFKDSSSYQMLSGVDSLTITSQGTWSVKSNLVGVYLMLNDSSQLRLGSVSNTVITFSRGELEPKFVRFSGDMNELTEERWLAAH